MRRLLLALGLALLTIASAASQTSERVYRLAIIVPSGTKETLTAVGPPPFRIFFQELRRLGYVEGQNLKVERDSAGGRPDAVPELVRWITAQNPDVIFTTSAWVLLQIKAAVPTVPAVGSISDPVGYGVVASLAHSGDTIARISADAAAEVFGKRLQLLREMVPPATKVALLTSRENWENDLGAAMRVAAGRIGLSLVGPPLDLPVGEAEYRRVFSAMAEQRPDALLVDDTAENLSHRRLIADLAQGHRLPALYPLREYVNAGGTAAYAPDLLDFGRQAAVMVDAILRGEKPDDVRVYQPTRFLLIVNRKSAREIGLEFPPAFLALADDLIEAAP
jgi:putative tryptophan/tyrosine transport system substrate-binding protein